MEATMAPYVGPSKELLTSWTLGRSGRTLTCVLVQQASGGYVLRLRHEGRHVLDEKCGTPQQAVARSLEAFHVFVTRGWLPPNSAN
jgi:hypothetical protein